MRRVVDVRSLPCEHVRNTDLLAQGVVRRRLPHSTEIVAKLGRNAHIGIPAEEDVFRVPIDPREVPQQISDVRADPEIMQLPYIDGHAHQRNDTSAFRGLRSAVRTSDLCPLPFDL